MAHPTKEELSPIEKAILPEVRTVLKKLAVEFERHFDPIQYPYVTECTEQLRKAATDTDRNAITMYYEINQMLKDNPQ